MKRCFGRVGVFVSKLRFFFRIMIRGCGVLGGIFFYRWDFKGVRGSGRGFVFFFYGGGGVRWERGL